jgi:hypothetical protein
MVALFETHTYFGIQRNRAFETFHEIIQIHAKWLGRNLVKLACNTAAWVTQVCMYLHSVWAVGSRMFKSPFISMHILIKHNAASVAMSRMVIFVFTLISHATNRNHRTHIFHHEDSI